LAVTYSLPWNQWYLDESSEWTLDYPPFFAYFEWMLSHLARFFDPAMLNIKHLNYTSPGTLLFQRLSVIASDTILLLSLILFPKEYDRKDAKETSKLITKNFVTLAITFLNAGLLLVDHIHFQYNGMLFGILIFSISFILRGKEILGALTFAMLLNFKHIFLYVAPVYFVYLLRQFCFIEVGQPKALEFVKEKSAVNRAQMKFSFVRFFTLVFVVMIVFVISFGPFAYSGQLPQVLKRLFPFKRGLVHAYWAPNFWALYIVVDKILSLLFRRSSLLKVTEVPSASMTGGLVGSTQQYGLFVEITPLATLVLTVISLSPSLYVLGVLTPRDRLKKKFIPVLVQCALCAFMFGWHVHEKAILMAIIPLSLTATEDPFQAKCFLFLSITGNFSLFPLLFLPTETPIKILLWLFHSALSYALLQSFFKESSSRYLTFPSSNFSFVLLSVCLILLCRKKITLRRCREVQIKFSFLEKLFLLGLLFVQIFSSVGHSLIFREKYAFLPLLLYSTYCAVGISYFWARYYFFVLFSASFSHDQR
jgi:alpha-1,3-glucosyltransferase